jgi:adenylate cyclase
MDLTTIKAIELAISHEMEARSGYLRLAEETDDPELKRLLKEIAQEEAGHEVSLRSRLRLYQEKHLLRDTISRYVSPAMCEEIIKNPALLRLGGERRQVTVLFADIGGFTSLSEKLAPEAVVEVLNTFFTEMVDLVFEHQGTLDKFLGDALMAEFGVPVPVPQAAARAVACALAMQARLADLRQQGRTLIQAMRIGINTGEAIVGNIGSHKRMDFTVIGDAVNVAARLLEAAKDLDAAILISEATFRELEGKFATAVCPALVLRGRQEPTGIYQVKAGENP